MLFSYFIEMNSDDKVKGTDVGLNRVLEEGKKLVEKGLANAECS